MTYQEACNAACEGCAKGFDRFNILGQHHWIPRSERYLGSDMVACKAPTKDQFIEQQAARIAELLCPRNNTYACLGCGRQDGMDITIPSDVWNSIEKYTGKHTLCLWCIDKAAIEMRIRVEGLVSWGGEKILPVEEGGGVGLLVSIDWEAGSVPDQRRRTAVFQGRGRQGNTADNALIKELMDTLKWIEAECIPLGYDYGNGKVVRACRAAISKAEGR